MHVNNGNFKVGKIFRDVMILFVRGGDFFGKKGVPHDSLDDAMQKGVTEIWINDVTTGKVHGVTVQEARSLVTNAEATHIIKLEDCRIVTTEDLERRGVSQI